MTSAGVIPGTPESSRSTWSPGAAASSAKTTIEIPRRIGTICTSRRITYRCISSPAPGPPAVVSLLRAPRPPAGVPGDLAVVPDAGRLPVLKPVFDHRDVRPEVQGEDGELIGEERLRPLEHRRPLGLIELGGDGVQQPVHLRVGVAREVLAVVR